MQMIAMTHRSSVSVRPARDFNCFPINSKAVTRTARDPLHSVSASQSRLQHILRANLLGRQIGFVKNTVAIPGPPVMPGSDRRRTPKRRFAVHVSKRPLGLKPARRVALKLHDGSLGGISAHHRITDQVLRWMASFI